MRFTFRLFLLCVASLVTRVGFAQDSSKPNILFIYTDDQSTRTVGCYPESFDWVTTPNIDDLAEQGVRFQHAYIGSWCMPSRATMLTGLHQHGIESMRMEGKYPGSEYDPTKCRFWPAKFRSAGYTTAQIGKWHTGTDAGFGRDWDHQIVWNRPAHPDNAPNYYDHQLTSFDGGQPKMVDGYTTDNYTNWAIDFIQGKTRDKDKPWFLWLCYGAVHGPFTPAERHLQAYPDAVVPIPKDIYPPREGKPKYANDFFSWDRGPGGDPIERNFRKVSPVGMKDMPGRPLKDWVRQYHQGVLAIDEGVGRLMKSLKETGQDDNTLVVYTSDQGFAWGQHGLKSKVAPYRAAVAAPLIVRGAKKQNALTGHVVKKPVSGVDIAPTFFAAADLPLPWKMHGHDLTPLLTQQQPTWEHPAMLVHTAKQYGSDTNEIPPVGDPRLVHGPGVPWYVSYNSGRYKYLRTLIKGETEELYNVVDDPEELVNLATHPDHQKRLKRFRRKAIEELKRTDAGFAEKLPEVGTQVKPVTALWNKHEIHPPAKGGINSAVAGFWNDDKHIDVISSFDGEVFLLTGPDWQKHSIHKFRESDSRTKPRAGCIHSCTMDVDGDGDLDFVGSNLTVFWLECPDDPLSGKHWKYRTVDDEILGTHCLITGDVNLDGKLDLIANSGRPSNTPLPDSLTWQEVPRNPHDAKQWVRHVFADRDAPGASHYTGIADVDGDGLPDISCAAKGGKDFPGGEWFAWWQQPKDGEGPWRKHLLSDRQPGASNIHPVKVDSDEHMDFVATRGHTSGVLWFKGPKFEPIEIDSQIEGPHSLVSVDLDEDGDIDIATCGRFATGQAAWYENSGEGTFTKHVVAQNQGSYDMRAVDMDFDGDLDFLIAGHDSKNIVWLENPRM